MQEVKERVADAKRQPADIKAGGSVETIRERKPGTSVKRFHKMRTNSYLT